MSEKNAADLHEERKAALPTRLRSYWEDAELEQMQPSYEHPVLVRDEWGVLDVAQAPVCPGYEQKYTSLPATLCIRPAGYLTHHEGVGMCFYHGGYFGMPRKERRERTAELLETFSLTAKRDDRTRTLSGGMKRRLILARALMHRPRLLILDEPTAGVDVELRLELWHYVQRINAEGTTILLTTHYLEEAEQLCDKIAFINEGNVVAQGSAPELASTYGVANLEDAYLELVGRKELSRSHVAVVEESL